MVSTKYCNFKWIEVINVDLNVNSTFAFIYKYSRATRDIFWHVFANRAMFFAFDEDSATVARFSNLFNELHEHICGYKSDIILTEDVAL